MPKKANKASIGYIAGYIKKAEINSPLIKNNNERCNPHPGQSTPSNCLEKQGSIKFSNAKKRINAFTRICKLINSRKITIIFVFTKQKHVSI
tara:strand:+ start:324 stop:599 length:276 start_codon:yes stop_codon:yes gene_type:complete